MNQSSESYGILQQTRTDRCKATLSYYNQTLVEGPEDVSAETPDSLFETDARDFLVDLMHYLSSGTVYRLVSEAHDHYMAERSEEEETNEQTR